jgi:hypothetical protein
MAVNLGILSLKDLEFVEIDDPDEFKFGIDYCNSRPDACSGFNVTAFGLYYEPVYYAGMSLIAWFVAKTLLSSFSH